jgi:NAD(P)-dependent dehydrogenase (short-subunit alcohol dehydrogenase family)
MLVKGKVVVVTGGASGIGRALATEFAHHGAKAVVVADINAEWATRVAERVGGLGIRCDVANRDSVIELVERATATYGPIDVFCSNAGIGDAVPDSLFASRDQWERIVGVNMLAHVWAAQAVVPSMVERGAGYLLQTISSAALITGPSPAGYTTTKHGALGFAEWLALNYGPLGIRVSCLCPNAVYTGMLGRALDDEETRAPEGHVLGEIMMPEEVAKTVLAAMKAEKFLILPHARVGESFLRKATDYDNWIAGTQRRLQRMRQS